MGEDLFKKYNINPRETSDVAVKSLGVDLFEKFGVPVGGGEFRGSGATVEWEEPTAMEKVGEVLSDTGRQIADTTVGTLETGATLATGMASGITGLAAGILSHPFVGDKASKEIREYIQSYTYKPQFSESGKGAVELAGKAGEVLNKPREIATELGGEQWGNLADVAVGAVLWKSPKIAKYTKEKVQAKAGEIGKALYRKQLRPGGGYEEGIGATETGFKGKFWLHKKEFQRFKAVKSDLDNTLNFLIEKNANKTAPMESILKPSHESMLKYAEMTEEPLTHIKAVDRFIGQRRSQWMAKYPDGNIPVSEIQKFKTTLYDRYSNAYGETKKAMSTEVAKANARASKEVLEELVPDFKLLNPLEGDMIQFLAEYDKAMKRVSNEKFTFYNSVLNNTWAHRNLVKMFRKISGGEHLFSNEKVLKAYLANVRRDVTVGQVLEETTARAADFVIGPKMYIGGSRRDFTMEGRSPIQYTGSKSAKVPKKQIGYDAPPKRELLSYDVSKVRTLRGKNIGASEEPQTPFGTQRQRVSKFKTEIGKPLRLEGVGTKPKKLQIIDRDVQDKLNKYLLSDKRTPEQDSIVKIILGEQ